MTVITRKRRDSYAIVPNAVADDHRLTFEERGLLLYLLAKPHDWRVTVSNLQRNGRIGRDRVYRILRKLASLGYVERVQKTDAQGRFLTVDYTVYDYAIPASLPFEDPEVREPELPLPENQDAVEPLTEIQEAVAPLPENPVTGNSAYGKSGSILNTKDNKDSSSLRSDEYIPHADPLDEFENDFWPAYPRKVGKRAALRAFKAARKRASLEDIMAGLRRYAAERSGEDPSYTKHPSTWLNGDCWADEPAPPRRPPPRGPVMMNELTGELLRRMSGHERAFHDGPTIDASHDGGDIRPSAQPVLWPPDQGRQ